MTYSQYFLIVFLISNSIVQLIAQQQYTQTPKAGAPLTAALRRTFDLRCQYNGNDDAGFGEWFRKYDKNETSVKEEKQGHYEVKQNEHESNLTIKIFVEEDAKVEQWYVKTKDGRTPCRFNKIQLIPSPQGMHSNKNEILETPHESIRRIEGQPLSLRCIVEPPAKSEKDIHWEFSPNNKEFGALGYQVTRQGDTIKFDEVQKIHRGYYRCTVNDYDFTILLRVKDKLAPLWPFIGIVSIVVVLVIIILIFEKRQKSNKKSASTDDDDQDHASDPLVRTTNKTSDNDSKKRAVKA